MPILNDVIRVEGASKWRMFGAEPIISAVFPWSSLSSFISSVHPSGVFSQFPSFEDVVAPRLLAV